MTQSKYSRPSLPLPPWLHRFLTVGKISAFLGLSPFVYKVEIRTHKHQRDVVGNSFAGLRGACRRGPVPCLWGASPQGGP